MYQAILNSESVIRLADGALIPNDPGNVDRQAVVEWLAEEGNELAPAVGDAGGGVAVPTSVSPRQARLALLAVGKLDAVTIAISSMPAAQRQAAQIEWEFAATVERASPLVTTLADALDLSDVDLDDLFIAAGKL